MTVPVGVVGVGSMGSHHARIYDERSDAELVGVADADPERAREEAATRDTEPMSFEELLDAVDAVSVAVPTSDHAGIAWEALGAGVHVLVEKPFVDDTERGRRLVERADARDLVLQAGHVERFNPAVEVLPDVIDDQDVVAVDARRLGPPLDRTMDNGVVLDLMIHDIDVALSLLDADVHDVSATRAGEFPHVDASLTFEDGTVASLTASRISQRRMRQLTVTTPECLVLVDYLARSVEVYRKTLPEYVETDGDLRYRNETVVERPVVENGEPLEAELGSFLDAVRNGTPPVVSGADGIRAVELARRIRERATAASEPVVNAQ